MTKTIKNYKVFWVWDFEKEEQWLNEMAAQGYNLIKVGFCAYTFERCNPGEFQFKLELLDNMPSHHKSRKYIEFIEGTGAEYVGSLFRWVYFRKRSSEGPFELFSDIDSRITHLDRILALIAVISLAQLPMGLGNLGASGSGIGTLNLFFALIGGLGYYKVSQIKKLLLDQRKLHE